MKKLLLYFSILFILTSCNNYKEENRGYYLKEDPEFGDRLVIDKEDTTFFRFIGSNNEKKILQNGVVLKYHLSDGKLDSQYSWGEGTVVQSCIVKYAVDDTFFIVEQKALDDIFGELKIVGNEVKRNKMPSTVIEMKIMLNQSDCSKFWIINIKTNDIYGPFVFDEFVQKRKELGVSDELILKDNKNL